jgi:hypothetical protein
VVYDHTGKTILKGEIFSENSIIEIGDLAAGIYLISLGENLKQIFVLEKE